MKKRIAVFVVLLAFVVLAAIVTKNRLAAATIRSKYDRIQIGMSLAEAESILKIPEAPPFRGVASDLGHLVNWSNKIASECAPDAVADQRNRHKYNKGNFEFEIYVNWENRVISKYLGEFESEYLKWLPRIDNPFSPQQTP